MWYNLKPLASNWTHDLVIGEFNSKHPVSYIQMTDEKAKRIFFLIRSFLKLTPRTLLSLHSSPIWVNFDLCILTCLSRARCSELRVLLKANDEIGTSMSSSSFYYGEKQDFVYVIQILRNYANLQVVTLGRTSLLSIKLSTLFRAKTVSSELFLLLR